MEGKDRWEQKGRIFLSFSIFFTLLSTTSRLPFRLLSLPKIYHPTLVHRQVVITKQAPGAYVKVFINALYMHWLRS